MPGVSGRLRLAFDRLRGVGAVLKFQGIAIDDSVVDEPEHGGSRGDQHESCYGCARGAEPRRTHLATIDRTGHQRSEKPPVIAREASCRQTKAAFRERLRITAPGLAEIHNGPDEQCQVQGLTHCSRLHVNQIWICGIHQRGRPRGNSGGEFVFYLAWSAAR